MRSSPPTKEVLELEARKCRFEAAEYAGQPEEQFLFRVATALEQLALTQAPGARSNRLR